MLQSDFDRLKCIFSFFNTSESFQHDRDIGNIFEVSSDGKDLCFYDMVKVRKTGLFYKDKEIVILNVTPYAYTNLEGACKVNDMHDLNYILNEILLGYVLDPLCNLRKNDWRGIYKRKTNRKDQFLETESEWYKRTTEAYKFETIACKGFFDNYHFFFVGDDPFLLKPLSFVGYCYYFAYCLGLMTRTYHWTRIEEIFSNVFGKDRADIDSKYQEYVEIAKILGVTDTSIPSSMHSLEEIWKTVKSKICIYFEVSKYYFGNGRNFSKEDHKIVKKAPKFIRNAYAALSGKFCIKDGEEDAPISHFTAISCADEDVPLLINTTNEDAQKVRDRRLGITSLLNSEREVA